MIMQELKNIHWCTHASIPSIHSAYKGHKSDVSFTYICGVLRHGKEKSQVAWSYVNVTCHISDPNVTWRYEHQSWSLADNPCSFHLARITLYLLWRFHSRTVEYHLHRGRTWSPTNILMRVCYVTLIMILPLCSCTAVWEKCKCSCTVDKCTCGGMRLVENDSWNWVMCLMYLALSFLCRIFMHLMSICILHDTCICLHFVNKVSVVMWIRLCQISSVSINADRIQGHLN